MTSVTARRPVATLSPGPGGHRSDLGHSAGARPAGRPERTGHPPDRRPLLVVVPDPSVGRARRRLRVATLVVGVAACAGLFGVVALHVLLAEGQEHVADLEGRLEEGLEVQQDLRTEVARMESPAVVVAAARDRLGMSEPDVVVALEAVPPDPELVEAATGPAGTGDPVDGDPVHGDKGGGGPEDAVVVAQGGGVPGRSSAVADAASRP